MRALLYLRKSTDEHQADSIDTQRSNATTFVGQHQGQVVDEIVDEGESRAEFKKRPGFTRLLAMATATSRTFDTVVVRDESRLGAGERLVVALDDIIAAGVAVYYYSTGERVQLESAEHRLIHSIRAIIADSERAKTAGRTREALELKARSGLNVGGRCYGYDNIRTVEKNGKGYTSYAVNAEQARVIVDICERYVSGLSERAIAKQLNSEGVPSPRAGRRGIGRWSPGAIREILRRPRYRGRLEWGKLGAAYRGGTRVVFDRSADEVTHVDAPHLRIIDEELDRKVRERIARTEATTKVDDRVRVGRTSYLLSGKQLSRCGLCTGPIQVMNRKDGPRTIKVYGCAWHRDMGNRVCTNQVRRPVEEVDAKVIDYARSVALAGNVFDALLEEVKKNLAAPQAPEAEVNILTAEAARLRKEIDRLAKVIAITEEPPESLAAELDKRTKRLREVQGTLAARAAAPAAMARELERVEDKVRRHLADLRAALDADNVDNRRAVIETLYREPLTMTPTADRRFEVAGVTHPGDLFRTSSDPSGIVAVLNMHLRELAPLRLGVVV